ncbi:MAG: MFS transporter [Candidatus Krumholzibacteria bacterium]|nr:MFS transporter [Candidatus Krumholzibacteria bacterium]
MKPPPDRGDQAASAAAGRGRRLTAAMLAVFAAAQTISLFGDRLNNFSLAAMASRFAADPSMQLAWIYLAMYLPVFLLAPLAGLLIDRLDKRWVLVVTDLVRGLLVMLIPVLFVRYGSFLPVMMIVFLLTTGNLFFLPAKSGLLPEIVPPGRLVRINSILWGAGVAGFIGGFLGGGLIFDYWSWAACFYLDGATYLVSALLLLSVAMRVGPPAPASAIPAPPPAAGRAGFWHDAAEGVRELRRRPSVLGPLLVQALIFFGAGGFSVLALVLIQGVSAEGSSMGLAAAGLCAGVGMALGSVFAERLSPGRRRAGSACCFALMAPAAAAVALARSLPVLCAGAMLGGLSAAPLIVLSETALQTEISPGVRGRVFALREVLTRSLFLLSSFLFSMLGAACGRPAVMVALGVFLAITGPAAAAMPRAGGNVAEH